MTTPVEPDATTGEARATSRFTQAEGWLALAIIVGSAYVPSLPFPEPIPQTVGITFWALAWLFAISGVRRGRGGARVAATISLAVLVLHAALILLFLGLH